MPSEQGPESHHANDTVATWCIGTGTNGLHRITMRKVKNGLCNNQCPWHTANHGKSVELFYDHEVPGIALPVPFSFAPWKRAAVWRSGLQHGDHGYGSLCHVRLKGTTVTPQGTWKVVSRPCTGALVMQQRELLRRLEHGHSALTPQGTAKLASDLLGRNVTESQIASLDKAELLPRMHPSLLDPAIGCNAVAPLLAEDEKSRWQPGSTAPLHKCP